ncbi:counting factor 60 [Fusarium heterosporum]|uniref:Counting factor 60 n=1 Tax=Fusarium heterosporum TaxID=42747 RepID=A0A8H5WUN4_FUSHE|nr:counting factor 60 [Fusarium heterosporum]
MTLSWFRCRGRILVLSAVVLFGTFYTLSQYTDMAISSKGSLLAFLSAAPAVLGKDSNMKWFPPSSNTVNDLDGALNGEGTYGFIFDSSHTPDEDYGIYNWCNMPHARKKEYKKPSVEYDLQYVEVIQRHHKRTPYASNAFPVESYQWNCDNQGVYYFGRQFIEDPKPNAQGYWKGFISDINPFTPSGWIGSCQFPQITTEGLDDSWVHGKDLYEVYHDLLNFIPSRKGDWKSKVKFRVTNNQITSQVAGMFINGMYQTTDSVPLHIQQAGIDSLEPQYKCSVGAKLTSDIKSSSNKSWKKHLDQTKALYKTLDDISGVPADDVGFHESFDHYYDNLSARQCHNKPLPCKLVDGKNSSTCIDQKLANTVYRLGQWEYSQMFRDAPASLAASATSWGVWVAELASHFRAIIAGKQDVLYLHNFAHDGSVSRLLSILQIDVMVWPGMGSEVVFELYKKKPSSDEKHKGEYFVRVLFSGQTLKSSHPDLGLMEMVPVETLLAYFDGLTGENASLVKERCSGDIPL